MLKMRNVSEMFNLKVFTDAGEYFGDVDEAVVEDNKIFGWRVRASPNSILAKILGSAKGVIVPHPLVKAIADIMIISRAAVPSTESTVASENRDEE